MLYPNYNCITYSLMSSQTIFSSTYKNHNTFLVTKTRSHNEQDSTND